MRVLNDYQRFGETEAPRKSSLGLGLTLLFAGIGIGALVALLYAPETGRKTRRRLRRRYEDARDTVNELREQAGDLWDRGSNWAGDARERVAEQVKPIRKAWGK